MSASDDGLMPNPPQLQAGLAVVIGPSLPTTEVIPPILINLKEPLTTELLARGDSNTSREIGWFLAKDLKEFGGVVWTVEIDSQDTT